jgi:glycosyltransferase involved in cell wall biosynthesis
VIVDDASTDDTVQAAKEAIGKDTRFELWSNRKRQGAAFNQVCFPRHHLFSVTQVCFPRQRRFSLSTSILPNTKGRLIDATETHHPVVGLTAGRRRCANE